jgi:hypothetical protein
LAADVPYDTFDGYSPELITAIPLSTVITTGCSTQNYDDLPQLTSMCDDES